MFICIPLSSCPPVFPSVFRSCFICSIVLLICCPCVCSFPEQICNAPGSQRPANSSTVQRHYFPSLLLGLSCNPWRLLLLSSPPGFLLKTSLGFLPAPKANSAILIVQLTACIPPWACSPLCLPPGVLLPPQRASWYHTRTPTISDHPDLANLSSASCPNAELNK